MQERHAPSNTLVMENAMRSQRCRCCSSCRRPGGREPVILGVAIVLAGAPLRLQLAVLLETVERREQRPGIDLKVAVTEDGEPLRDAVAVHRLTGEDPENHQVEHALRDVQLLHTVAPLGQQDERAMASPL